MRKSIYKNTVFNMGYRILNMIFPLISSMYTSRILGANSVGRVSYAQNILSYFLVIASVGIPTYGIKLVAKYSRDKELRSKAFWELFIINAITTTLCILTYILAVIVIDKFNTESKLFLSVGISLFLNYFNIDWFYSGMEEYVYITIRSSVIKLMALCSLFIFVKSKEDVVVYAIITALGLTANYLLNIINVRKYISVIKSNLEIKKHIKPVLILLLTMFATDLYNQIDITMMGNQCSKDEIGYYSYALKLIRIVTALSTAISATVLPRMSQMLFEKDYKNAERFANKVMNAVLVFALPCTFGIILCSDSLILLLYGEGFINSAPIIRLVSPIIIIVSVSYLCGSITLTALNREYCLLIATLAGAITNICFNLVLIPRFNGAGAAVASVISEMIVLLLHYYFSRKSIKYNFMNKENIKSIISVAIMTIVVLSLQLISTNRIVSLILSCTVGSLTYFIVLYITKHTLVTDVLRRIKKKRSLK